MKFCRPTDHAVFDIGDDDGSVACALFSVTLDEAVVQETVKAVMATLMVEPR
jgi:hypothetical protein